MKAVVSWLTGYPAEVLRLDYDLGMDESKYQEFWALLYTVFPAALQLPADMAQYPSRAFRTLRDVARWFHANGSH